MGCFFCGAAAVIGWFVAQRMEWTASHEIWVGMTVGIATFFAADLVFPSRSEQSGEKEEQFQPGKTYHQDQATES